VYGRNITVEKVAHDEIHRLSLVASTNESGVLFTDIDGRISWANNGFCTLSGYSLDEVIGKTPIELLHGPMTKGTGIREMLDAFGSGKNFQIELVTYRKDGSTFWGRTKGQAVYNDTGELAQYFALIEDITIERETQDALIKSEERWQFALEGAGDGVWEYNFQTKEVFFSKQYKKMLGFSDEEFPNRYEEWISRVHPDDQQIIKETDRDYRTGFINNHQREFRMMASSGQYIWILDRGMVVSRMQDRQPLRIIGTYTDITDRKSAEQALQFKEEKYRNILVNMNLGILEVDLDEKIQYVNQCFADMCGFQPNELMGVNPRDILVSGESDALMQEKVLLREKGKSDAYEIAVQTKQGEMRWWLVSGAPSYNDKGELVGSIGIHLDITDQRKLQDELLEAQKQAEASARAKEVFLANMSHEIRTPMHAISGMSELLSKTKLIERQRFYLSVIQSASENMLVILNDILDLSKLEASKLSLESIGFNMRHLFEKAITVMKHRADEKGLMLEITHLDPAISPVLVGDPYRLNQILSNLLSNAIKFTKKGRIEIECHLEADINHSQTLLFKVRDTGIGMDTAFLERLFEKFSQEHESTSRNYGGTGLGMNITKELVDLMKGKIKVESEKGTGTVFSFWISFRKGNEQDLPVDKHEEVDKELFNGLKILLVDDNDMNRLVANTMLENLGARVVEAVNGKQAVDFLMEETVDLILMDIQMPVMDGLEATREIKKQTHHHTPIIALTANALKSDNEKYIEAGMVATLPKPFSENEIIKVISEELGKHFSYRKTDDTQTKKSLAPLYDLANLDSIARGNPDFIQTMIKLFLQHTPPMVTKMKEALEQNDLVTMSALAHKMRPSLDNLGIVSMKETAMLIEKAEASNMSDQELRAQFGMLEETLNLVFESLRKELKP
jgi:PAS domain S-box-containing protein